MVITFSFVLEAQSIYSGDLVDKREHVQSRVRLFCYDHIWVISSFKQVSQNSPFIASLGGQWIAVCLNR